MRRRLTAIFLVLAALVGGLLTGIAPAFAATSPMCRSESHKNATEIVCELAVSEETVASIVWAIGSQTQKHFNNSARMEFYCQLGRAYDIFATLTSPDGQIRVEYQRVLCKFNPR